MRTVTYNLIQFLTEARRGAFVIPRFQRPFIWNHAQVKLLVDSIARNYPVGSLLLLQETMPNDPFLSSRPIEAFLDGEEDDGSESEQPAFPPAIYYVLDGQQRLTSLVRVFQQASRDNVYYFDLERLYESEISDRNAASWVIRRSAGKRLPARYLRSETIADDERCSVLVQEFFESNYEALKGDRAGQRKAVAKVNRVFETMRNYQIPLVIVDRGDSTEAICRIFETINSTGTRLTTFDLAVARFFPRPDLHALWQQSIERHPCLRQFEIEGERVLQLIAIAVGQSQGKSVEPTRSALLNLSGESIELRWQECSDAFAQAVKWVEEHGSVPGNLASEAMLVPLAYLFLRIDHQWKVANPSYTSILQRWHFANALQQGSRQASNYKIGQAVSAMHRWLSEGVPPEIPTVFLNQAEVMRLSKTDARYQALLALILWKSGRDIWTGEKLISDDVEDHHIFPAALIKREGLPRKLLDSVANRMFVSKATNRQLGDRLPADYLGRLIRDSSSSGTIQAKLAELKAACLPITDPTQVSSLLDPKGAQAFVERRAEMILAQAKVVLGDALVDDQRPDDSVEEDSADD